jgi:hypothetical protein
MKSSRGGKFARGVGRKQGRKPVARKHLKRNARKVNRNESDKSDKMPEQVIDVDINNNSSDYFSKNATFDQHFQAQETNRDKYVATVMAFDEYSIEILANAKARSLAAAMARHDKDLIDFYLNKQKQFGFADVLKAVNILDSRREKLAIEKKIARVANNKSGSVMKPKKMGKLKNDMNNLERMKPKGERAFGFSGAMCRMIKKWTRKFSERELEFFCLGLSTDSWKKLADIVHLHPTKDLQAAWFLPYCFGQELPKGSKIERLRNMTAENVNQLVTEYDNIPYSYLKKFKDQLTDESKEKIALQQEKLDTIVWYYEDLACPRVDDIIRARLEKGDKLELAYGKLMERLLMFKDLQDGPATGFRKNKPKVDLEKLEKNASLFSLLISKAEDQLKDFKSTIPTPVAVLGDASSSMSVAIRTATIISSLLTAICSAKLTFFNHENFESKSRPENVEQVIDVAFSTQATGSTAPAASLVPYYNKKEVVKTFIIVTDEEENTNASTADGKSWRFKDLFMEYRKVVYPASLIFVSFLHSQHNEGQMYREFVKDKVEDVLQFKFDRSRPDLTKLDSILGSICSKSSQTFSGLVEKLESEIKTKGLTETFDGLKVGETNEKKKEESVDVQPTDSSFVWVD